MNNESENIDRLAHAVARRIMRTPAFLEAVHAAKKEEAVRAALAVAEEETLASTIDAALEAVRKARLTTREALTDARNGLLRARRLLRKERRES